MDKRLEKIMQESLGVSVADVERMNDEELHSLYDKATVNEEIKALEASDTTEDGETPEAADAALIVDWLWGKIK
jgi:hypothetical protein